MDKKKLKPPLVSACMLDCPDACSFLVDPEATSIRANPKHPFTKKFICRKGRRFFDRLNAPERIVQPLLRKRKTFVPVNWDKALDLIAGKLNALHDRPEAVLHVRGYGYRGVLAQASVNFFAALGSSTTHGSLCDEAGIAACIRDFGVLTHNNPEDLLHASRIVNWGKDLSRSSPHTGLLIRQARKSGAMVLTISPGGDNSAGFSDACIRIRPGRDRFLAAWVIRKLMDAGTIKPEIIQATSNWPDFHKALHEHDPDALLRAGDVDLEDAEEVLAWYAAPGPTATLIGWGLQRYLFGGQNVRLINALALLSGQIGRSGGGTYFNISSSRNLGLWSASSSGRPLSLKDRRSLLLPALAWEMDWADPAVEFVWVDGHNVVNQVPDSQAARRAFRNSFVVCVDAFFNDTAIVADLILPPALMLEREDIIGSSLHDYLNYAAPVLPPRGSCRSDYEILRDLGQRLEPAVIFPGPDECLAAGLEPLGMDLAAFRARGFAQAKHPAVAFEGLRFAHPDRLYHFPERLDPEPGDDPDYPLQLLSLVRGSFMHSQIPEAEQQELPKVWVSSCNPELAGLDGRENVFLATPLGRMAVQVETAEDLHPLTVVIRRDGWMRLGHGPNAIIEVRQTDMGQCAAYYTQPCRLEGEPCRDL
ncbi:MAG TPA: nitrate reductase [Desulfonatronum sp.]|nr:nitrate reductase [Desulfonatronum sp.]